MTHSLEWIPVSIQMAGRLVPPVLNYRKGKEQSSMKKSLHFVERVLDSSTILREEQWFVLFVTRVFICSSPACFTYLEHIQGTTLVALTDHNLADQFGILSHQHVLETVDLNQRQNSGL